MGGTTDRPPSHGPGGVSFEGRETMEAGRRKVEERSREEGPGMRLMRLWLWTAPLAMLALAALFGWLAVDGEEWGLLAAMVVLALVAVGLFVVQWRLLRGLSARSDVESGRKG